MKRCAKCGTSRRRLGSDGKCPSGHYNSCERRAIRWAARLPERLRVKAAMRFTTTPSPVE